MTQLAIGYVRTRANRQGADAPSPDEQRIACEKYAAKHRLRLMEFHFDDAGGGATAVRPGLTSALDSLARDDVTALVIPEFNALGRDHDDVIQTMHLLFDNNVTLHTVAEGRIKRFGYGSWDMTDQSAPGGDSASDGEV